jgi:hypothetical protein
LTCADCCIAGFEKTPNSLTLLDLQCYAASLDKHQDVCVEHLCTIIVRRHFCRLERQPLLLTTSEHSLSASPRLVHNTRIIWRFDHRSAKNGRTERSSRIEQRILFSPTNLQCAPLVCRSLTLDHCYSVVYSRTPYRSCITDTTLGRSPCLPP